MVRSMTGYGRCRVCREGREMTLELKAVNHRFLDPAFRLPKNLGFLEETLRALINRSGLQRGHVEVFVAYQNAREDARAVSVDRCLLSSLRRALDDAGDELQAYAPLGAGEALALSGALSVVQADEDVEAVNDLLADAFSGALEQLQAMRQAEGEHLSRDLLNNLDALEALRESIARRAPEVPLEYRRRLEARLEEWLAEPADPQRVAQEVALMADRCAIDEELSRLEGHIRQFAQTVEKGGEAGRRLDFLLQEMNREVNTIGSKAADAAIVQAVVDAKCVVEKLREQVQNAV